jgi:hypothetical protein
MLRAIAFLLAAAVPSVALAAPPSKDAAKKPHAHARRAPKPAPPPVAKKHEPPSVAPIAREIEALSDDGPREARCRALTGYAGKGYSSCSAELVAHGEAVLVRIETECGCTTCTVEGWLFARGRAPVHLADATGTIDATPSLDVIVRDVVGRDARGEWTVSLHRVDAKTGASTPFAACMSATLSPRGRFFACRDKAGNVLRVPLTGGEPTVVVVAGDGDRVDFAPEAHVYPDPVAFRGDRTLAFDRFPRGKDEAETVTTAWSE